ncbi:hypothetical protein BT96DRAFT_923108 [Gymnopus androsaceus JB14]|uniref:Uncharacterized protein n=1 Tax=Gymnopus androsaceus JB14 TaxID=1447944 RepID=A0A6A4HDF1_9AGAR|nr:hypothetical protein BT96DRAFT_923108 [Gymnopus androsaceus JB14]
MDCLCDEILQLIFYELHDPTPFVLLSKRLYKFSQDPYTRAHYFLNRYGPSTAVFEALGRGKIVNERVLDILMTSGADLSRYLCQLAMHHYFYTQTHFIKTKWVRNVPLPVFLHFMQLASARYGEIPREKGQDDGSIFTSFLKESRYPPNLRTTNWEIIRDILEKYNFIPFSTKDPIMAQFPLALAIEPRLLPYAVANGFYMDAKYRDFVFRKMFESSPNVSDRTAAVIVQNVQELCRLDPSMFLSRTVAAEVCLEAKANETGYSALKLLAKSGDLLFDLPTLVEDLIKLFLKTRSLTSASTQVNLRQLFADFPTSDPVVRLVILLTAFLSVEPSSPACVSTLKAKLEPLKLGPITLADMLNLLIHPFIDRHAPVFEYMKVELESPETGRKGLTQEEMKTVVENVATRLLEIDCKGKLLKRLHDLHTSVHESIIRAVMDKHQVRMDDLPDTEDVEACMSYRSSLCKDKGFNQPPDMTYFWSTTPSDDGPSDDGSLGGEDAELESEDMDDVSKGNSSANTLELGAIGRETLSNMIRQDELLPSRSRRRFYQHYFFSDDHLSFLPADSLSVARWIKADFGPRSSVTAIFMTHAVLNDNGTILRHYLHDSASAPVPLTLRHFELLARLGRAANYTIFAAIQGGTEYFRSEEDYIDSKWDCSKRIYNQMKGKNSNSSRGSISHPQVEVLIEHPPRAVSSNATPGPSTAGKKRPRRSVAANRSYVIPDSDDEADAMMMEWQEEKVEVKKKVDHLQLWIDNLGELQKSEQAKCRERKKRAVDDPMADIGKTEFLRSLSSNLRALRKYAEEKRKSFMGGAAPESDYDDDDYVYQAPRAKKRKLRART